MCEKHCDGCDGDCNCHDVNNFLGDSAFHSEVNELVEAGWDAVEQAVYMEADLLPSNTLQLNEAVIADWNVMRGFMRSTAAAAKIDPPRFMKLLDDIIANGYSTTLVRSFTATLMTPETREMLGIYAVETELKHLACILVVDHDIRIEKFPVDKQIKIMAWLPKYLRGNGSLDRRLVATLQYKLFMMMACAHVLAEKKGVETGERSPDLER